jgi:hypothetical protein
MPGRMPGCPVSDLADFAVGFDPVGRLCRRGSSPSCPEAKRATLNTWLQATAGNYGTGMDDPEWFDFDGPLTDDERAFLHALRQNSEGQFHAWCRRGDPLHYGGALIVGVDVDAPHVALLTPGVHLEGDRARGDSLHNQTFALPDRPTALAIDVTGSPASVAASVADWLAAIVRRPIVRYEWLHTGGVYAHRYLFADTGEGLVQMYNRQLAPAGQYEELIAARHFHGNGWIDTRGLGEPDRITPVRGNI